MPGTRSGADRPRRFGAAFLVSCVVHAAMVVLVFDRRPALDAGPAGPFPAAPPRAEPVELAMVTSQLRARSETVRPESAASALATRGETRSVAPAALAEVASRPGGRAAGPRFRRVVPEASPPVGPVAAAFEELPAPADEVNDSEGAIAAPSPSFEPRAPSGALRPDPMDLPAARPAGGGTGEPGMDGDRGEGTGAGAGRGRGSGEVAADAWGKELRARILGDVRVDLSPRDGRRVIGHEQATALRVRDVFPRMPEALWPGWRPYLVTLEVCVDEQGEVGEVDVLSSAAPRLDQMVAAAARTWRYRPLVLDGVATSFCHAVVIKYEPW